MKLLFLVVFLCNAVTVHRLVTNYNRGHSGWITLELDHHVLGKQIATVTQVDWCESMEPNPPKESKLVIRELLSCSSPGLMRDRLYPGELVNLETPNVVHIDPQNVGGWDEDHQAQIVVQAEFNGGTERLEHVFRFNPLYERIPPPPASSSGSTSQEAPHPSEDVSHGALPSSGSTSQEAPHPLEEVSQGALPSSSSGSQEAPHPSEDVSHGASPPPPPPISLSGPVSILGVGLLFLLGAALLGQRKQWKRDTADAEEGWVDIMMRNPKDEDNEEENMRILLNMGNGANPVFLQNL